MGWEECPQLDSGQRDLPIEVQIIVITNKPPWRPQVGVKRYRRQTTEPAQWASEDPRERPGIPKLFLGLKQRPSPSSFRGDTRPGTQHVPWRERNGGMGRGESIPSPEMGLAKQVGCPREAPRGPLSHSHPFQGTDLSPRPTRSEPRLCLRQRCGGEVGGRLRQGLTLNTGWRCWRRGSSWPPSCPYPVLSPGLQVRPVASRLHRQSSRAGAACAQPSCLLPEVGLSTARAICAAEAPGAVPPTTPRRTPCGPQKGWVRQTCIALAWDELN